VILNNGITPGALSFTGGQNELILKKIYAPIVRKDNNELTVKRKFEDQSNNNFLIEQDWKVGIDYTIDYSVTVYNLEKKNIKFPEFYVWAGGISPIEYLSGDIARSEAHRIDALDTENNQIFSLKVEDKKFPNNQETAIPVRWISISNKYFANILKPLSNDGNFYGGIYTSRKEKSVIINGVKKEYYLASAAGIIKNVNLNANASATWNFKYYAGPKEIKLIGAFAPYAKDVMHLAFTSLESIAQWLLYFLIFLRGLVGNYGWAIVLLTLIVKLVFWPITHKSNVSMKKMQKIQPMVKELREKYKDDKQMVNTKMMELYKKEGVNPLGGCLPILVQIPVFFALYWTLDGAIELRHTSFLWAKDLTQPDTIGHIFGLPINPLAIAMSLTMVLQQKLTPTATDPMQAKMMMLMPVIMLIFLYNLPSGLTLYWTVSQIISIVQLIVNIYNDKKEKSKTNLKTA
jgi:YidC/Oxa1 family membrane protein insertase